MPTWRRLAALLALVLAGCAAEAPSHLAPSHAPARTSPDQKPSPGSGPAAHQTAAPHAVTLAFAGDVNFASRTARLLKRPLAAFGPIRLVLSAADFTAVNLETAVTTRGVPQPKQFHFRTTGKAFTAVRAAGIDLVTMANNHVLDYGRIGLHDTLAAAHRARFPYVGIGRNARAAWAPYVTTIRGVRIAVIGVSPSWPRPGSPPGPGPARRTRSTSAARWPRSGPRGSGPAWSSCSCTGGPKGSPARTPAS